jgi:hypothetical protein
MQKIIENNNAARFSYFFQIKKLTLFITMLGAFGCANTIKEIQAPSWYINSAIPYTSYEYIGYGQGPTKESAMLQAQAELAQSIRSEISVVVNSNTQISNNAVHESFESKARVASKLNLSDVTLEKIEEANGAIYVAYKYSNLPLAEKIINAGINIKCSKNIHPYLSRIPVFKSISKRMSCLPEMQVIYKNKNWYLLIEGEMFALNKQGFEHLFVRVKNPAIQLKLSNTHVKSGDIYSIELKPEIYGYASLVQIFDSGQIKLLIDNKIVNSKDTITFPDLTKFDGLYAEANGQKRLSKDLTLAILCNEVVDLSDITEISVDTIIENNQSLFSQLMHRISGCSVSSNIINIVGVL